VHVPVFRLDERIAFPDPHLADESGLLAVGGDLSPSRLLLGYSLGIFPWYNEDSQILWHSPDPRMVLVPSELHVSRSLAKVIRKKPFEIRYDTAFSEVIDNCARVRRPMQNGTWITPRMVDAYKQLHELGFAHSVEAFEGDVLVGGLYGVALGTAFFGESMYATASDASKVAFIHAVQQLERWGYTVIDCQVYTEHLERFGAREWPRDDFLRELYKAMRAPS
jgi:leucyl/phenylalanyl-tRNA--protein transferase